MLKSGHEGAATSLSRGGDMLPSWQRDHVRSPGEPMCACGQKHRAQKPPRCARRGFTIIELLTAMAITAMLLTATMVAIDASFKAYADTAAQSSTQVAARMVTHRLMSMLRTSTAHGPLMPDLGAQPPVILSGQTITSHYLELIDSQNNLVRVEYRPAGEEIWVTLTPLAGGAAQTQPILRGVTHCTFFIQRRFNEDKVYVLKIATIDMTVRPSPDTTLELENSVMPPIRVVASTMSRRLH